MNREHLGLYCLEETINAQLLGLSDEDAVLYKAFASESKSLEFETFSGTPPNYEIWDGWEQKYPDPRHRLNWEPLRNLRDIVVNKSDAEFISLINTVIDTDNFIDYYILLNLLSAGDNTGKNNFLIRSTLLEPLALIPWDMDLTLGLVWPGVQTGHTGTTSNALFQRLLWLNPGGFKNKLKARWVHLRSNVIDSSSLLDIFESNFSEIKKSGIINIENSKWNENINIQQEQDFLNNWLINRINFLDEYFANL
jgi:spore coat protein CotH